MNDLNFRSLENMQVPDELIERLLAIPETAERKPAVIPWYRRRAAVAAASLVLVSVLSLTVYFLFGTKNHTSLPISPSSPVSSTVQETTDGTPSETSQGSTDADENPSVIRQIIDSIFRPTEPQTATQPTAVRSTQPQATSAKPVPAGETTPQTATEKHEETPTEPPTETPIEIEPTEEPPEPVAPTEPPDLPDPTDPPDLPDPTESPYTDIISDLVYIGEIPDGSVIYCWLYNPYRLCDDDAYTEMFYADVTPLDDGYAFLDYQPKAHGVTLPYKGRYRYLWYLSYDGSHNGRRLYSGDVYLNN